MASRRNTSLVAADYGRRSIRLLQLNGLHVSAMEVPCEVFAHDVHSGTADPGGLAADLRSAVEDGGFHGTRCSVTLPASCFLTDTAVLPDMESREEEEGVGWEAVDRFGLDREAIEVRSLRLNAGPQPPGATSGTEHLILAIRRETISHALDPLIEAGLVPVRMEMAALAGLRLAWMSWRSSEPGPLGFLHVEQTMATLLLVRDGEPAFHRAIVGDFAGRTASPALTSDGDAIPLEVRGGGADRRGFKWSALAEETLQCLRYVERRSPGQWPAGMLVSGPASGEVELLAAMEGICGVKTTGTSASGVVEPLPATLSPNTWAAALGAAAVDLDQPTRLDARRAA